MYVPKTYLGKKSQINSQKAPIEPEFNIHIYTQNIHADLHPYMLISLITENL